MGGKITLNLKELH